MPKVFMRHEADPDEIVDVSYTLCPILGKECLKGIPEDSDLGCWFWDHGEETCAITHLGMHLYNISKDIDRIFQLQAGYTLSEIYEREEQLEEMFERIKNEKEGPKKKRRKSKTGKKKSPK